MNGSYTTGVRAVGIPQWSICVTAALIALLTRTRTHAAGLCQKCGYDLRAHRPGQRCPECGTPIPLDKTRDRPPGEDLKPPLTDPPAEPLGPG
jgi:tRNA(Ile2) C34 agmatinyltransferase TiaS